MSRSGLFPRWLRAPGLRGLPSERTDVLVVGSGIAGLSAAIAAAGEGARVLVVTKRALDEGSTSRAQGGIAAVLSPGDTVEEHIADTLSTGQGLSDPAVAETVVREGVQAVRGLMRWGVRFDRAGRDLAFGLEGGHSHPRVLHAGGDATGREIERALIRKIRATRRIRAREHVFTLDLLQDASGRACGALVAGPSGDLGVVRARAVILATGGAGQLYRETTNPEVATGDGIAMALRCGTDVADLEFVQFHPTTLYVAGASRLLVSEAARGEGGVLRDRQGVAFMAAYHPSADLAPRDVVSRAIVDRMRKTGDTHVYLDLTRLRGGAASRRFPRITEVCRTFGVDPDRDPVPVRPTAHYTIGGVAVDLDGRASLSGLFACGEVSMTGLHGANRLASNSLLEGLVFGLRAGRAAASGPLPGPPGIPRRAARRAGAAFSEALDPVDARNALRSLAWRRMGIEREASGLTEALRQILFWERTLFEVDLGDAGGWELQNLLLTAHAMAESALAREESRGTHYRTDFPERQDARWLRRLVWRSGRLVSAAL